MLKKGVTTGLVAVDVEEDVEDAAMPEEEVELATLLAVELLEELVLSIGSNPNSEAHAASVRA